MPMSATPMLATQPLTCLPGVGPVMAAKLAKLGLCQIQDLLFHLPIRYQDRTRIMPISRLQPFGYGLVDAKIIFCNLHQGRKSSLVVQIADASGSMGLRFFHFSARQRRGFDGNRRIRCFGEVRSGPKGLEMVHPQYQLYHDQPPPLEQSLTPIYPATDGISQLRLQQLVDAAFTIFNGQEDGIEDLLAPVLEQCHSLPSLGESLQRLHQPPPGEDLEALSHHRHPARQRLILEELMAHRLSLLQLREKQSSQPAPVCPQGSVSAKGLLQRLPFSLTAAQARVWQELGHDLAKPEPMVRMVQGDVGSGKTIIAALAGCQVVDAGCQVTVLAPTEILAEQHLHNFRQWLQPLQLNLAWLAGKLNAPDRRAALAAIADGRAQVVIGTHALFQDQVNYHNLGLVIIDEQHRFGVAQRHALLQKARPGTVPHQLVMTATPIPRSLAMSTYADMDHSVIDELPPGRKPVNTVVMNNGRRDQIISRIATACSQGQQVYWVCTLIETSDSLQCEAAEATVTQLQQQLPTLRVGLVHGRFDGSAKSAIMEAFKQGDIHLLVATTVIEVGVDVTNANLMIIDNAERLGLAQLHQLRGRVGRGARQSHCILLYQQPLSRIGRERLAILRDSNDGFEIAAKDLQLRGPGEVLGTRQAGAITLRIADLVRDEDLSPMIKRMTAQYKAYPELRDRLVQRWLGNGSQYAMV